MSEVVLVLGALLALAAVAVALLGDSPRLRLASLTLALVVASALVVSRAWGGPLQALRDEPASLLLACVGALLLVALVTAAFVRIPSAFPLAAVAALPFRVPIELGGETSNLLVPLYLVLAAGLCAALYRSSLSFEGPVRTPRLLRIALAVAILAYGLAATYSLDREAAVETVAFFVVPFGALFCLLEGVNWSRRLLLASLVIVVGEASIFALVAIAQQVAGEVFWNRSLIVSNEFHLYLRSNSLFWDPNVFGRYAAVAVVLAVSAATWAPQRGKWTYLLWAGIVLSWSGLLFSWSQSGFIALVGGLLALAALRYSAKLALIATPVVAVILVLGATLGASADSGRSTGDEATSGRESLVSGGLQLAADRPVYGWGAGSFPEAFGNAEQVPEGRTTVSHTEPVTVLAEQGLIGFAAYAFLTLAAAWTVFGRMRGRVPGLGARPADVDWAMAARIGLAAVGLALFVHTLAYAGNLTDPLTWTLLALAGVLRMRGAD